MSLPWTWSQYSFPPPPLLPAARCLLTSRTSSLQTGSSLLLSRCGAHVAKGGSCMFTCSSLDLSRTAMLPPIQPSIQPAHTCCTALLSAQHSGCCGKDWQLSVCFPLGKCPAV